MIIGVDEVGRGPLAGPVVACAAFFTEKFEFNILDDSKKLSSKKRQAILQQINGKVKYEICTIWQDQIDQINILNATKLAMKNSIENLIKNNPDNFSKILIDGNFIPDLDIDKNIGREAIIKGDQKNAQIMAASIIAKEFRDDLMIKLSKEFNQYDWHKNMGYGTKFHREQIQKIGICKYHRKSFVKNIVN
ncbi:ribonuclease HII [Rickettsiales bacterium]|nr:ribonuclease HII [Rickettsiales bacterium]